MASTSSKSSPAPTPARSTAPTAATPKSAVRASARPARKAPPKAAPRPTTGAPSAASAPDAPSPPPSAAPVRETLVGELLVSELFVREASTAGQPPQDPDEGPDILQLSIATVGALLVGVLYLALPTEIVLGPRWLPLVVEAVLLAPPIIALFTQRGFLPHRWSRTLALALLVVMTVSLLGSVALLIINLPQLPKGGELLRSGALIWCLNILVFGVWYWETDGNGPKSRRLAGYQAADFQFPQQADGDPGRWKPGFIDYVFLAFCTATALSPADTMPLTRRAKLLMMVQSVISLLALVLIIGRSVNII